MAYQGSAMLHPPGIVVPDWPPPFQFALGDLPRMARTFLPAIEAHYTDAEAWELLFDDENRLAVFRSIHGNRKGPKPRPPKMAKPQPVKITRCPHGADAAKCRLPECAARRSMERNRT
jgi:hypothetical protein